MVYCVFSLYISNLFLSIHSEMVHFSPLVTNFNDNCSHHNKCSCCCNGKSALFCSCSVWCDFIVYAFDCCLLLKVEFEAVLRGFWGYFNRVLINLECFKLVLHVLQAISSVLGWFKAFEANFKCFKSTQSTSMQFQVFQVNSFNCCIFSVYVFSVVTPSEQHIHRHDVPSYTNNNPKMTFSYQQI